MIKMVSLVSIPVRDQSAALEFYTKKLGFELVTDQPFEGGQRWIELALPGTKTHVALFTPKGQENRIGTFSNVAFSCRDVAATYGELKKKGVKFAHAPKTEPWGSFTVLMDQDGNRFSLSSRR